MKIYSENKSKTLKLIVSVSLAIVAVLLLEIICYWAKKPSPPFFLDCAILLIGSVGLFRFINDESDEDDGFRVSPLECDYLIWSTRNGPSTWEEASQLAKDKGDNWRLPTASELNNKVPIDEPSENTPPYLLWTKKKGQILSVHGGYQTMPTDGKAHYYLVSEI